MVSLRRRKHLGLRAEDHSTAVAIFLTEIHGLFTWRNSVLAPIPYSFENGICPAGPPHNAKSVAVHPLRSDDTKQPGVKPITKLEPGSLNICASSSSKEQQPQLYPEQPIKRRKRHRRKHVHNQEPCLMRGVYFKNMKWQAAIKVDKKQIHLGTVGSQEEAARLYDRAAFMCGREPNFELSEEEKQELRRFKWDEFLAITRSAINIKKSKRRSGLGAKKKLEPILQNENWNSKEEANSFSASEEVGPDSSAS